MTTDAARRAVFDTPELLENIIFFLPMTTILSKAQRVSRAWNTLIRSSHSIQTKLWLLPRDKRVLQPNQFYYDQPGTLGGLLGVMVHGMPAYSHLDRLNPLLPWENIYIWDCVLECSPVQDSTTSMRITPMGVHHQRSKTGVFSIESRKSSIGYAHSWERMQLADPPIAVVMLQLGYGSDFPISPIKLSLRDNGGITLGHVNDALYLASSSLTGRRIPGQYGDYLSVLFGVEEQNAAQYDNITREEHAAGLVH